ncbi:hypothetical protein GX586_05155 [bacterium]|nr:hypothetical protein [bacterium]
MTIFNQAICTALSVLMLTLSSGCSAFRSWEQTVSVNCTQSDAVLTLNGQRYTPPAQVSVRRNRDVSVQAYKPGFVPYQQTIGHHLNTTGVLDIIGACIFLLPGIGLFFPGAWSLDETNVTATLYPQ